MSREELMATLRGNAREEAARVVGIYATVHDVCRRNGLGENDARMVLERINHDERDSRQFVEKMKRALAAKGVSS